MPSGARPPRLLRLAGLALLWPGANPASAQSRPRPPQEEVERFPRLLDRYRDERIAGDPAAPGTLAELERAAERLERDFGLEGPALRVRLYRGFSEEALREDRRGEERIAAAFAALSRSDPAGAEAAAAEASAILRRIDNPDRLAVAEGVRANAAWARGDYASAAAHFREQIQGLRRVRSRVAEALVLGEVGRARAFAGDAGWRSSFDEGLAAARAMRDPELETELLVRRGALAHTVGEREEALASFRDAVARAEEAGSASSKARALLGIAEVHLAKRDLGSALGALAEAERQGTEDLLLAATMAELRCRAAFLIDDGPGALRYARRALDLAASDPLRRARALVVLGVAAARAGDVEAARAGLEEAAEWAAGRVPGIEARARHNLGILFAEAGDPHRALAVLEQAREAALRAGDRETLAASLAQQALALLATGERDRAIDTGLRALDAFEPFLVTPATDRGREEVFEAGGAQAATEATLRALLARGGPRDRERAFEVAEAARARSLLGNLREIGIDPAAELPADLRARRESCLRRYRLVCTAIEGASDAASEERLRGELERIGEEMAEIARQARGAGGSTSAVLEPATYARAAQFVSSSRTALLLYYLGERESFLFALSPEGLLVRTLPSRELLEARAAPFLAAAKHSDLVPQARQVYPRLAKELGKTLLPPDVRPLLASGSAVVVPDGVLEEIPFEAFAAGGANGPGEAPTLSYAPSCAVLLELDRRARAGAGSREGPVLLAYNASGAPELSFDETEVAAAAGTFDRSSVIRLERASCDKDALLERVGRYRVLHLALHGEARDGRIGLRFSSEDGEESILWPHEVYGLGLRADLVVLSGCSTGGGRTRRGAGVLGLAHAFVLAGASRVVVTLWPNDDEATARTLEAFYAQMRAGRSVGEALARGRAADARSLRDPLPSAPLILIGPP